ncbi:MAG: patatin-like phospholipase family protein [Methyloligellaceae bacterium]
MAAKSKSINLALQGGGAHGAFTWGVLDYFLESGRVDIEAISGASAGAMNAVVIADGLMKGGADGARQGLQDFWEKVSKAGRLSPVQRTPIDMFMGNWSLDYSPGYFLFDLMNQVTSPYQTNPLNINPLKDILESVVCFDQIKACNKLKLFISATNVENGRVKVFDQEKLTADMVMASACLPFLFQAVEIDEVPYWDGGYMGNPVLYPFFYNCKSSDVVIVQINPIERKGTPKTPREIMDRVNEITFNSSLLKELRSIDFVHKLLHEDRIDPNEYKDVKIHIVEPQELLKELGASSKVNAEWAFLKHLFGIGRDAAGQWLDKNYSSIGKKSSVNLKEMFQGH